MSMNKNARHRLLLVLLTMTVLGCPPIAGIIHGWTFSVTGLDKGLAIAERTNGSLFIAGVSFSPGQPKELFGLCVSPSGERLWTREISGLTNASFSFPNTLGTALPSGESMIAGELQSETSSRKVNDVLRLVRFNVVGQTLWNNTYTFDYGTNAIHCIAPADNDGTYVSGNLESNNGFIPFVVKIDRDGNVTWLSNLDSDV